MSDTSLSKGKLLMVAVVWIGIIGVGAIGFKYLWKPAAEKKVADDTRAKHDQTIADTSSPSRYRYTVDLAADLFSGYAGLRSQTFKNESASYGVRVNIHDDGADYPQRLQDLASGKVQMAVFTIDALIKASANMGDLPATVVCLIDETKGADAMLAAGKKFPNIDSLNSPGLKIVCVGDSPSETLARVCMAHFNLDQLSSDSFDFKNSPEAVVEAYKKSKPDDNQVYVLWEPYVSQLTRNSAYHVLVDSSKFRGYIVDVIVVQREFLLKNETIVENVVKAYLTTVFKNRNDMVKLVMDDAKAAGAPLTQEQANKLVEGIWWKNTQDSFGHFGFTTGTGLQHIEEICENITKALIQTGAISSDPTNGQFNTLYHDGIMRKLFDTSWHPGFGREVVREEKELAALSEEEWKNLKQVGTLQVPRLVFARGTANLSNRSHGTLDDLAQKLNTWPQYYLTVRSNTSAKGDVEANKILALQRAQVAIDYLVRKGINSNRIHAQSSKPNGSTTVAFILGEQPY